MMYDPQRAMLLTILILAAICSLLVIGLMHQRRRHRRVRRALTRVAHERDQVKLEIASLRRRHPAG